MANYTEPFQAVLDYAYPKFQYTAYHDNQATYLLWLNNHCKVPFTSAGQYFRLPIQTSAYDATGIANIGANAAASIAVSTSGQLTQDALKFSCAAFAVPILTYNYQTEVQVGSDKNRVYDYYLTVTEEAAKRAQNYISAALHSNNGTTVTDIIGLQWMVDQTDTTWGGLTRASTNYDGQWPVEDETTTSITWKAMENMYMNCRASTDLIVTTKSIFGYIWALRQAQEKYDPIPAGKEFAAVGAPYIAFNQVPIVWDENCAAANVHFLCSKYIKFFQHTGWNMSAEVIQENYATAEAKIGRIKWAGQHTSNRASYLGRMSAVTS